MTPVTPLTGCVALHIRIPEALALRQEREYGVPHVSREVIVYLHVADHYLLIEHMEGFNDHTVQALLEACDHEIARAALDLGGGCLVDLRAPGLPAHARLYAD